VYLLRITKPCAIFQG